MLRTEDVIKEYDKRWEALVKEAYNEGFVQGTREASISGRGSWRGDLSWDESNSKKKLNGDKV